MLRKLSLVAIAAASLGAAALAPTSASAWVGWHGGWHGWGGPRVVIGGPAYYGGGPYESYGYYGGPPAYYGDGGYYGGGYGYRSGVPHYRGHPLAGWSARRGDRSGAWSIAATDPNIPSRIAKPRPRRGFFAPRWNNLTIPVPPTRAWETFGPETNSAVVT